MTLVGEVMGVCEDDAAVAEWDVAGELDGDVAVIEGGATFPMAMSLNTLNEFGAGSAGGLIANTIPEAQCPIWPQWNHSGSEVFGTI